MAPMNEAANTAPNTAAGLSTSRPVASPTVSPATQASTKADTACNVRPATALKPTMTTPAGAAKPTHGAGTPAPSDEPTATVNANISPTATSVRCQKPHRAAIEPTRAAMDSGEVSKCKAPLMTDSPLPKALCAQAGVAHSQLNSSQYLSTRHTQQNPHACCRNQATTGPQHAAAMR